MRTVLLGLGLALSAVSLAGPAVAPGDCAGTSAGAVCAFIEPCNTRHTRGVCVAAMTPAGAVRGTCQASGNDFAFCTAGGGAQAADHRAGGSAGCVGADRPAASCHAGASADRTGLAVASASAGPGGVCGGAFVPAAGEGVRNCAAL